MNAQNTQLYTTFFFLSTATEAEVRSFSVGGGAYEGKGKTCPGQGGHGTIEVRGRGCGRRGGSCWAAGGGGWMEAGPWFDEAVKESFIVFDT